MLSYLKESRSFNHKKIINLLNFGVLTLSPLSRSNMQNSLNPTLQIFTNIFTQCLKITVLLKSIKFISLIKIPDNKRQLELVQWKLRLNWLGSNSVIFNTKDNLLNVGFYFMAKYFCPLHARQIISRCKSIMFMQLIYFNM